mmetsp:Transcript_2239/g.5029  ORF Transcript_2239/g.5029 Transcript_2239/m.5029 type:complete len:283 (+) Transcript_2239:29-877(+)
MTSYSKKITITASDLTSEPVWADPNGEFVTVPGLREIVKDSIRGAWRDGVVVCFLSNILGIAFANMQRSPEPANLPKIRGLQQGSIALDPVEKANLIARLEGNWKIQPLQVLKDTRTKKNVEFTDVLVRGDKIILSGGVHNGGWTTSVTNQTEEQTIRPYRAPDGTIYIDNFGSILISESSDGGEVELDNALGIKFLWQRGWKQMAGGAPTGAAAVVTATPVTAMPTSTTGVATEISALKRLMDQGILTKDEYEKGKANVLAPAASHGTTNSTPSVIYSPPT